MASTAVGAGQGSARSNTKQEQESLRSLRLGGWRLRMSRGAASTRDWPLRRTIIRHERKHNSGHGGYGAVFY